MPWKECHVTDERSRFVARLLDGEKMARLCAEFGISRKTGYKIFERYQRLGVRGLTDRSRRPYRYANQLPPAVETLIVRLKREYPTWGTPASGAQSGFPPLVAADWRIDTAADCGPSDRERPTAGTARRFCSPSCQRCRTPPTAAPSSRRRR